jgi:hypothetical protein
LVVVGVVGHVPGVGGAQARWLVEGSGADGELFGMCRCPPKQGRSADRAKSVFDAFNRCVPAKRCVGRKHHGIGVCGSCGHIVPSDSSTSFAMTVVHIAQCTLHRIANSTACALPCCTHVSNALIRQANRSQQSNRQLFVGEPFVVRSLNYDASDTGRRHAHFNPGW